jgi:hypothetical protein
MLIEHIKSIFRMDPVPLRGYDQAYSIVLLDVLLYLFDTRLLQL